jgi:hypothetical protein
MDENQAPGNHIRGLFLLIRTLSSSMDGIGLPAVGRTLSFTGYLIKTCKVSLLA